MIGLTMCSGIGAPEVAAPWVDWRLAAEIEPFPREVLRQRFGYALPDNQNQGEPLLWGDMTEVTPDLLRARGLPLPDLIVAGTPCQAFSVAGARKGVEDARGNLTLKFVEIVHAFAAARHDGKLTVLWENVPGVLSDKGNAFGCFLGGLVGALDAIPAPAGGTWPGEGMVAGPRARLAWATLDAQWFGVAQRRRRVFVVVDFGGGCDPAAVLLEPDSMRGDHPPRREPGQGFARGVEFGPSGGGFTDVNPTLDTRAKDGPVRNQLAGAVLAPPVSMCLNAGGMGRQDAESETLLPVVTHALRGEGFDASEDGTGRGTPIVPVSIAMRGREDGAQMEIGDDCAFTLRASTGGGDKPHVFAPVAFDCKGTQVQYCDDGSHPTLRSMGHNNSHQNGGGHAAVTYAIQERAVCENPKAGPDGAGFRGDGTAYTLEARTVPQAVATPWAVRRLTPRECERLQGFQDDHTAIAWRGKAPDACPDGPRYKAIGNSMAVPVMRWILDRIRISHQQERNAA